MTHTMDNIMFFSVVMRETVHITLTMAAMHDLDVKAADILNAYVMALNHQKIRTVFGPKCGDNAGKSAIKRRALYRLQTAGALFWHIFQNTSRNCSIALMMQIVICR